MIEPLKIDPDRLTLGDLEFFERAGAGEIKVSDWVSLLSRLTGLGEAEIRALPLKAFRELTGQLKDALKAASGTGEA